MSHQSQGCGGSEVTLAPHLVQSMLKEERGVLKGWTVVDTDIRTHAASVGCNESNLHPQTCRHAPPSHGVGGQRWLSLDVPRLGQMDALAHTSTTQTRVPVRLAGSWPEWSGAADQAGIWARTRGGGQVRQRADWHRRRANTLGLPSLKNDLRPSDFPDKISSFVLFSLQTLFQKQNLMVADAKSSEEAGAAGSWHCRFGQRRTHMGKHGWVQMMAGWLTHTKLGDLLVCPRSWSHSAYMWCSPVHFLMGGVYDSYCHFSNYWLQ